MTVHRNDGRFVFHSKAVNHNGPPDLAGPLLNNIKQFEQSTALSRGGALTNSDSY